jgi:alpha-1,2-mannosyltransferase
VRLPAYFLFGSDSPSELPGSLTAAFLSAVAITLMFSALRRHLTDRQALVAAVVFGFATPMWTISGNMLWPHTVTVLGIAGMAWSASSNKWWSAGVFGGFALWGRLHTALIVAFLGIGVGLRRRQLGPVVRAGVASGVFLLGTCVWNRWMYGSWNPLGGYGQSDMAATENYRYSLTNQLGMWVSPDRGILVWTPIVLLLVPALVRSWRELPDWSRSLLVGGLVYTVLQASMITFTGGDGFYGYRYGLEFLACATPALALSQARSGRVARVLCGPVLALQGLAFLLGALFDDLSVPKWEAWHRNAFVHALALLGPAGWALAALVAGAGLMAVLRAGPSATSTSTSAKDTELSAAR